MLTFPLKSHTENQSRKFEISGNNLHRHQLAM